MGSSALFEMYRVWYEAIFGMSVSCLVVREYIATPILFLPLAFFLGLCIGMPMGRWRRLLFYPLWVGAILLVGGLIFHIFTGVTDGKSILCGF